MLRDSLFLPHNVYRLKLSATDASGQVGFAETDVQTESIPTSGRMEISPATGRPLSTLFTVRTLGWTDEMGGAPYRYQLGFRYICSQGNSVSCVEWLTGITEDNAFAFRLPDIDPSLVPEVLLRVSDSNGAMQDVTQSFQSLVAPRQTGSGGMGGARLTTLLGEAQALVAGVDWIQGSALLTSLLASLDLDHGESPCNKSLSASPKFQLTNDDFVSLKARALPIVLHLYFTFLPCSQTHLRIVLSLLQKVTRTPCPAGPGSWTPAGTDGLLRVMESVVEKFNRFGDSGIISRRGFSTEDANVILSIYEQFSRSDPNGPSDSLHRVRSNITQALTRVLPDIGYGLCVRQSIHEVGTTINLDDFVNVKSSLINLPPDYITGGCRGNGCTFEPVRVNFGTSLFGMFLQWNCLADDDHTPCSGVCLTSSLFHVDLLWQGSEFSSRLKTPLLHLSLQNPSNGMPLDLQLPATSGLLLTFPIVFPYSSSLNLRCVLWNAASLQWESSLCTTEVRVTSGQPQVLCRCSDVGTLFYAAVERCPSGRYGETCDQSKSNDVDWFIWGCITTCSLDTL